MEKEVTRISGDRTVRKVGEAPNIGKVLRSPLSGTRKKRGGLPRSGKKQKLHRVVSAWSVTIAVLSLGIVLFFLVSYFRDLSISQDTGSALGTHTPDLDEIFSREDPGSPTTPGKDASLAIVEAALANRDPARVNDHFALRAITGTDEVVRILRELETKEGKPSRLDWVGTVFLNGMPMEQVVAYMESGDKTVNHLAMVVRQPDGKWRVDFDAYLRTTTPDWETILARKSVTSEIRVFIGTDTYYNGIYSDEKIWQAYSLVSPDMDIILYGYVKRNTPASRALQKIMETEVSFHSATLSILTAPEGAGRQFEISRVLAENWVVGDLPYDGLF